LIPNNHVNAPHKLENENPIYDIWTNISCYISIYNNDLSNSMSNIDLSILRIKCDGQHSRLSPKGGEAGMLGGVIFLLIPSFMARILYN
jgi:hypothetical protein|tara:strand:+ start:2319 stop:2585 length:267 start_codon:yes stop_codon:yes gene_type:complete